MTARTLHFPLYGDPDSGLVRSRPFEGGHEIAPVFGDGTPGGVALERAAGRPARRRPGLPAGQGHVTASGSTSSRRTGCTGTSRAGRRKKLRTIWLAEEVGSTDTAVAELKEIVGHVFESPKPTGLVRRILATMPDDVLVLDFFAGSGTTGHAVALGQRRGRRHAAVHQRQLRRAHPGGLQRPQRRPARRSPTSPAPGCGRSRRDTVADSTKDRDHRRMTSSSNGQVALVTGGSSGIGEATALELRQAGFEVYAVARRVDRMAHLEEQGIHTFGMDVTDDDSMVSGIERIRREQGRIDVLVNNAGYGSYGAVEDVSIDEARRQFEVNLFGLARLCQLVIPRCASSTTRVAPAAGSSTSPRSAR